MKNEDSSVAREQMSDTEENVGEGVGAPQPFFSEGGGDPSASSGGVGVEPGAQIGPYKLVGILGEGGYGVVYLAEQEKPIRRRVALKIVKPGMDSRQVIARFEAERQALALLDHPNLAHVYDAGTTEAGRPYFVMEYIEGRPITEYCDRENLDIRQRLQLFRQVCRSVQHAHQKAIIHRDLKPSNILVTAKGDEPLIKVIDFGVAKALAQSLTEKTLYTQQGQFIGTPDYMSPEQAAMDAQAVDTRSDVYSLGVVLYELLTGVLPFDPDELRTGGLTHMQAILRDREPKTPSTRLTNLGNEARKIAERRRTNPQTLTRSLLKELEWIPLKAMRKEASRRYQSASQLADDIENYLNGDPLSAGPELAIYRIRKAVQKHRVLVAAATVVAASLLIGFVVTTRMYLVAEKARRVAETSQAGEAEQRQAAEHERDRAVRAESEARVLLAESYEQQGRQYLESGRLDEALLYLAEALQTNDRLSARVLLAEGIRRRELPLDLEVVQGHVNWARQGTGGHSQRFAVSPDRSLYAMEDSANHTVDVYETTEGRLQTHLTIPELRQLIFTPDNKHIVARVAQDSIHHQLRIFDLESGRAVGSVMRTNADVNEFYQDVDAPMPAREELQKTYTSICMAPNSDWFTFADLGEPEVGCATTLKLWNFRSGRLRTTPANYFTHPLVCMAVSPAPGPYLGSSTTPYVTKTLYTIDSNHMVRRLNLPALEPRDSFPWPMWFGEFNPNGWQHYSQEGGCAELMDRRGNSTLLHFERIEAAGFSPNGARLVTKQWPDPCDMDALEENRTTSLWDTETVRLVCRLPYLDITNWHFTPNSQYLITEHANGQVRVWWSNHGTLVFETPATRQLRCVDISPDSMALLTGENNRPNRIQLWDLSSGDSCELAVHEANAYDLSQGLADAELDVVWAYSCVPPREPVRFNADSTCLIAPTGLIPVAVKTMAAGQLGAFVEACIPLRLESGRARHASPKELLSSRLEYYRSKGSLADQDATDASLELITHCVQLGELQEARQMVEALQNSLPAKDQRNRERLEGVTWELSGAYFSRGTLAGRQGRYDAAIDDLQQAVALQGQDFRTLCALAWLQAACPEKGLRQPERALDNAEGACRLTNWDHWDCLSTYAVALAGRQRFSEAVKWQEKALRNLPKSEQDRWRENYQHRLSMFRQENPYEQRHFWELPTRDLVGWWRLDEGVGRVAKDSSGSGLDGALLGNLQWELDSSRRELLFDGEGSYVDCGVHPAFDIADAFTVTAWIKAADDSHVKWRGVIAAKGTWQFTKRREPSVLDFFCQGVFTSVRSLDLSGIAGDSPIAIDRWHHAAAVFDGDTLYLYLDGRQDTVEPASGNMRILPEAPLRIGGRPAGEWDCWKGLIGDVRIYRRALNAEEVAGLYEQTKR